MEGNINLGSSEIKFEGSNSIVFLRSSQYLYNIDVTIYNDSAFYMGLNCSPNTEPRPIAKLEVLLSEQKHVFIGNDFMPSFNVFIRNSDAHLIYSTKNFKRRSPTKSVFIGDHVWIGQNVLILKGTQISSGSIIGAHSVVANKKIKCNSIWGGNPARLISKDAFWTRDCQHSYREEQTQHFAEMKTDEFTFKYEPEVYVSFDDIDKQLTSCKMAEEKMNYLIKISNIISKNRFAF